MDMRNSKEALLRKIQELEFELSKRPTKKERIYMQCLDMTLSNCSGWAVDGKKIDSAQGYCSLAKIFADHSISKF